MKKTLLSAAAFSVVAVSAVAMAPTTSEAIPAFARQTGSACLACHHNSFPALNAYGRAFKQGAFTSVGEQTLVEDDMLSITSSVNMSVVLRPQFVSTTTTPAAGGASTTTKTATIPNDQVLLIAGRVGTNTGAFVELGGGTFANFQLMNSWDLGGLNVGVSLFQTGFGETAGIEVGSTFGQHGGLLNGKAVSASEQLSKNVLVAGNGNIAGASLWVANDLITASISGITAGGAASGNVGNGWKLAPSARAFLTTEVGGFELGAGLGVTSGQTGNAQTAVAAGLASATKIVMKKWMLDLQLQGEVGDMGFGFYADYASAAGSTVNDYNLFNTTGFGVGGTGALKGYSARFDLKPIHTVVIGAGVGRLKDSVNKTSQWQVAAEYEVYQNFVIALIYNNTKAVSTAGTATTKTTTLDIEALL